MLSSVGLFVGYMNHYLSSVITWLRAILVLHDTELGDYVDIFVWYTSIRLLLLWNSYVKTFWNVAPKEVLVTK